MTISNLAKIDDSDLEYLKLQGGLKVPAAPLFVTDASGLFDAYLKGIPARERQHYNCSACRKFIEKWGSLATVTEAGDLVAAIWPETPPAFFRSSVEGMRSKVARARILGAYVSDRSIWGTPRSGGWQHLHIVGAPVYRDRLNKPGQAAAKKRQEYTMLAQSVAEFPINVAAIALDIARYAGVYRAERIDSVAQWFHSLHIQISGLKSTRKVDNLLWLAAATAPAGYCQRGTTFYALLRDIKGGLTLEHVKARHAQRVNPLTYQKPASVSDGNIDRAEEIVKKLGIERSLARRYARLEEIRHVLWQPQPEPKRQEAGFFGHLRPEAKQERASLPGLPVYTWHKFHDSILQKARKIELWIGGVDSSYGAIMTAVHPDAPPILQWDREEERNPFSWYVYVNRSSPARWGLRAGAWAPVTAIVTTPNLWSTGDYSRHGRGVFLLLEGARDLSQPHSSIFPHNLISALHEIRSTITAYASASTDTGAEEATACGLLLQAGNDWGATLRVTFDDSVSSFRLDRWD